MPGPGAGIPGYTPGRSAPPKPVTKPWITVPDLANAELVAIPSEPIGAWRALWHAIGSNLPAHVNASRASRAAMRKLGKTHG